MKWNRYLQGERVLLRSVEAGDLKLLAQWRNAPENWRFFFNPRPISLVGQRAWRKAVLKDPAKLFLIIVDRRTRKPVGTIGLDHMDPLNQTAEIGNVLIGDPRFRGAGLAREAAALLLDLAFTRLNLRRVYLYVFADNRAAVRLYQALGFKREGVLREAVFAEGRFRDLLLMAVLKREVVRG